MKTGKKFLSVLMVMLIVILMLPMIAFAGVADDAVNEIMLEDYYNWFTQTEAELQGKYDDGYDNYVEDLTKKIESGEIVVKRYNDEFDYTVTDSGIEILSTSYEVYNNYSTIVIPSEIEGMPVTSIAPYTFSDYFNLKKVVIPNSVEIINEGAFDGSSLAEVEFGDGVKYIGDWAFGNCELVNVSIGSSVETIGDFAFAECELLKSINLSETLNDMGVGVFVGDCSLEQIVFPDNIKNIPVLTFFGCEKLKSVTLGENTTKIDKGAFAECMSLQYVCNAENVKVIEDYAFFVGSNLVNIDVSDSLESIGIGAFCGCYSLENDLIGVNTDYIGDFAFFMCYNLNEIIIENNYSYFGRYAYFTCVPVNNIYVYNKAVNLSECVMGYSAFEIIGMDRDAYMAKYIQMVLADDEETINSVMNELLPYTVVYEDVRPYSTIHCYSGSTAETYAVENGFDYVLFESYIPSETEANCITKGSITYTCPCGCGDSYKTESDYNKENHIGKTELRNEVIGSCLADGYSGDIYCLDCGECIKTGEVVVSNGHIDSDNNNICDSCKADLTPPHTHTPETVVIPATCTASGVKYDICAECAEPIGQPEIIGATGHTHIETNRINPSCTESGAITYTCHCKDSYTESIPANGHTSGEWEIVVEATYESNGKKVIKCTVCNEVLQEESIPKLIKPIVVDEKTGVEIEHNGNYNGYVDVSVEETFDGDAFNIVSLAIGASKNKVFDIKLLVNGETVQPNGKVTVKIPVPEGYNPNSCFVYYINTEKGTVENISSRYENGYIIFETDHFSFYAVVDKSSIVEMPDSTENPEEPSDAKDDCSCNCHAGGIKAFFFKILNFFQKLFGKNKVCDCGIKH